MERILLMILGTVYLRVRFTIKFVRTQSVQQHTFHSLDSRRMRFPVHKRHQYRPHFYRHNLRNRNSVYKKTHFSVQTQLQSYAKTHINRKQTANAFVINAKKHLPVARLAPTCKGFSSLFSRRAPCTARVPKMITKRLKRKVASITFLRQKQKESRRASKIKTSLSSVKDRAP